ncbi:lipopolysaccharide biosynthesis protein [Clostridium vincentii]|uniref:Polysaccharide biosynthesis protein n=1 Tax=Clostridium vincentii TaxID=52704 RepID=A0A2T0BCZ7_9CLOT|nr:hypothetical protein [Clostridium vincentii]PRR81761.1 hypothetical protein CLVI_22500 [Clostridium vincentii]
MKSRYVIKNSFYAILFQLIVTIFGFITPRLIIMYYGSEINGLTSSINQVIRCLNLLEAGLAGAAVYELYKYMLVKDYSEINSIVSYANRYYKKIGAIFSTGILITAPIYTFFIVDTELNKYLVLAIFLILGLTGAMEFFIMAKCRIILMADQKSYIISVAMIGSTILYNVIAIILIYMKVNIVLVYTFSLMVNIGRGIILNICVKKIYNDKIYFKEKQNKVVLKKQKYVFIHEIFYTINTTMPLLAINVFYDLTIASIYAIYNITIALINAVLATVYQSVTSSYGNMVIENNIDKENRVFSIFQFWYLFGSAWLLTTAAFLITPFVDLYTRNYTSLDYNMPLMGNMLVIFGAANCIRVIFSIPISTHGFFKETAKYAVVSTIISVIAVVICGNIAAPLVLVGPTLAFIINAYMQKNYQKQKIKGFKNGMVTKNFALLIVLVVFAGIISSMLELKFTSIISFLLTSSVLCILIGVIIFTIYSIVNRKELNIYINYLLSVFKKKG